MKKSFFLKKLFSLSVLFLFLVLSFQNCARKLQSNLSANSSLSSASSSSTPLLPFVIEDQTLPYEITLLEGDSFTLSVRVSPTRNQITYQWFKDNEPLENGNSNIYPIEKASFQDMGSYHVEIRSEHQEILLSQPVSITVLPRSPTISSPNITKDLSSSVIRLFEKDPLTLSVTAEGGNIQYQWYFNDSPLPEATSNVLTINQVTLEHSGRYKVKVYNGQKASFSQEVVVEVHPLEISISCQGSSSYAPNGIVILSNFVQATAIYNFKTKTFRTQVSGRYVPSDNKNYSCSSSLTNSSVTSCRSSYPYDFYGPFDVVATVYASKEGIQACINILNETTAHHSKDHCRLCKKAWPQPIL